MKKIDLIKLGLIDDKIIQVNSKSSDNLYNFYIEKLKNIPNYQVIEVSDFSCVGKFNMGQVVTGKPDYEPTIGESFCMNNWTFHTSGVKDIIDDIFLITRNSVWVIHDKSDVRNEILEKIIN